MAVRLASEVEDMLDKWADDFVRDIVKTEINNVPVSDGLLVGSISQKKLGIGKYVVGTHAAGYNDVEYPLRIEYGEPVVPTRKKALRFWVQGHQVVTDYAAPSKKSHFAKKTILAYGGKYTGK